jgi:hypothetical protein
MSKPVKYFIVYFDDGHQTTNVADDASKSMYLADKHEKLQRIIDPSRRFRKAVRASELSSNPVIRAQQLQRIVENNKAVSDRQKRIKRKR